jgi:hypothetical protein
MVHGSIATHMVPCAKLKALICVLTVLLVALMGRVDLAVALLPLFAGVAGCLSTGTTHVGMLMLS